MIYTLKNDMISVDIESLGAEVISVTDQGGYEYIWQGEEWSGHAPILFPICGKLLEGKYKYQGTEYKLSSHGFARKSEFTLEKRNDTSITLSLKSSDATRAVYPFDFELYATYEIDGERLDLTLDLRNTGVHVMPYMIGWHPGFNLPGTREIGGFYTVFDGKKSLTWHKLQHGAFVNPFYTSYPLKSSRYYLSEEEIYSNDTMIFSSTGTTVKLAGGGQKRNITLTYSDNLPYLCLWKAPTPNARFICLEPWSGVPADGETPENFDSRTMSRLSVGEEAEYKYSVAFN